MGATLDRFFSVLTQPEGSLIYHLILVFSIAGAAALVMNGFLELPVYSEMDLFLTRSEPLTSGQGAILLVLAIAGALMGASGALLFRKYRSPVHHGGSLQNLERMEKMVDEPERRLGG